MTKVTVHNSRFESTISLPPGVTLSVVNDSKSTCPLHKPHCDKYVSPLPPVKEKAKMRTKLDETISPW